MEHPLYTTPAQRLIARLHSEGWSECLDLDFPALSQFAGSRLPHHLLTQLQQAGGTMELENLQLASLIFSIPAHEFQVHPHLELALQQLEVEGLIVRQMPCQSSKRHRLEGKVMLASRCRIQSA